MKAANFSASLRRLLALAAAMFAAPALAATPLLPPIAPAAPAQLDLASWVSQNTDLKAADVVIAGPKIVYSLEALGAPLPTGETVALVRTETRSAEWASAHGIGSWDAHILFDCDRGRFRVLRSAAYPDVNRKGKPRIETPRADWTSPHAGEPGAQLLSAACDKTFAWPLRAASVSTAPPAPATPLLVVENGEPAPAAPTEAPTPTAERAEIHGGDYAIQVAYGPFERGAKRALVKARERLGDASNKLKSFTQQTAFNGKSRYSSRLEGFETAEAANEACAKLAAAQLPCFTRRASKPATTPDADKQLAQAATSGRTQASGFAVQLGRGPYEAGARRALAKARTVLGPLGETLQDLNLRSAFRDQPRFTAVLAGFADANAARQACDTLIKAGQACLIRSPTTSRTTAVDTRGAGALERSKQLS